MKDVEARPHRDSFCYFVVLVVTVLFSSYVLSRTRIFLFFEGAVFLFCVCMAECVNVFIND